MKFVITLMIIFIVLSFAIIAQSMSKKEPSDICKERGHVMISYTSTLMLKQTDVVDNDSLSMIIVTDPNIYMYTCTRCGQPVKERASTEVDTIIIWRKPSGESR